jgi:transposase, IS30 family
MCYHRITLPLRYKIEALYEGGHTAVQIATQLGVHRTTITRELERCTPYTAQGAQQDAEQHRARRHGPRLPGHVWAHVTARLQQCHSPEQIHGRCVLEGQSCPSVERIYQYVYAHPQLTPYLRRSRSNRRPHSERRTPPTLWTSIEQRPEAANTRQEIGHLEADLMEGAKGKGSLVVMTDRCSRLLTLNLVGRKTAAEVYAAMDSVLDGHWVKTITIDQGREFVLTEALGEQWGATTYACHAHSPWEKGSVENANGLLRQFFPKKTDFTQVDLSTVLAVEHALNHRPRKILGYRTPFEIHSDHQNRALAT